LILHKIVGNTDIDPIAHFTTLCRRRHCGNFLNFIFDTYAFMKPPQKHRTALEHQLV